MTKWGETRKRKRDGDFCAFTLLRSINVGPNPKYYLINLPQSYNYESRPSNYIQRILVVRGPSRRSHDLPLFPAQTTSQAGP